MNKKQIPPVTRSRKMSRNEPYRKFRFRVEIDGIAQAGFTECIFGSSSTEIIEYREGSDPITHVRKLSGLTRQDNIILKWGITDSMELFNWFKAIGQTGSLPDRKNISVVLIDEAGQDKCRWNCINAWPVKYDPPDLSTKTNDVAIESVEITCEDCIRVS